MEVLSNQDIDFWEYNCDKGIKLLFNIYRNIKQDKTDDILICRDNGYNLCLKFQNDYLLTISTILTRLRNLSHYYGGEDSAAYFTNDGYDYHIYKHDDNSYILTVNYHNYNNIPNDNCRCFQRRSEYIRDNNLKNIENIVQIS